MIERDANAIERKPGEIGVCQEIEPYSVLTFHPGELFFIERQVFAACVDQDEIQKTYGKFRHQIPNDVELRKKFISQQAWSNFKDKNLSKEQYFGK